MSTLLKEAIIDAAALKEAALKNAEASIIEKYSAEVKEQLNRLLEQEDPDFKMIGYLKVRYYRNTKKKTKEIVYFKDLLNKYFNLLKENKSTKL